MFVKLMNADGATKDETTWGDGVTHFAENQDVPMKLCANTVIHFYEDEYLAVLMNPAHGNFNPCIARRFEPSGEIISDGTKSGCRGGTTYELIELPEIELNAKIRFGILCALKVYHKKDFVEWANAWLNDTDRSRKSAAAAYADAADAYAAAADAAYAYAAAAAAAADAAAAAYAADNSGIAYTITYPRSKRKIDFIALVHQAVEDERALQEKEQTK